jgi:hypothetical protein
MHYMKIRMAGTLPMLLLAGCAVVQSQVVDDAKSTPDGLVYFMPRRPFVVTVTTDAVTTAVPKPPTKVSVAQGTAEPDLAHRFVLSQGTDVVAKTEMNITVGANGLLRSSNTNSTSEVATALENLASAAGAFTGVGAVAPMASPLTQSAPAPPDGCPPAGTSYQYLIYPQPRPGDPQQNAFCGYTVSAQLAAGAASHLDNATFAPGGAGSSGIFYRHELPYVVTVTGPKDTAGNATVSVSILTSPDASEIDFFPVKESFFANNTANITLTDGVITGVDQTTEGELTAALSLPAVVLNSYTTAIGSIFGNLTTNSANMQKLLAQQQATERAQAQATVCRVTVAANPLAGLSGTQLTTTLAAITAACSSSQ